MSDVQDFALLDADRPVHAPVSSSLRRGSPLSQAVRSTSIRVRAAESSDLEGILEVYNHYIEHTPVTFEVAPVSVADRRPWFEEHTSGGRHRLLVAAENPHGTVVGWASTSAFRPRAAYSTTVEASVYVRPEFQGRGLGTRLYTDLFAAIRTEDVERIVAGVTLPNVPSVRLHRRLGFRRVGTFHRVGRKFGRYWDVAWFERPLRTDGSQVPAA